MKILMCICMLSGCLAAQTSTKTSPPPPAKAVKKVTGQTGIPKDAVPTTPGFYRWTDANGKAWTYRRTPFGVTRWPADAIDLAQSAADKANAAERTTAVEQGDSIRFEQSTPFGKKAWVRKKSELNESEQKIWDLQRKNSTASRAAEKE